MDDSIVSFLIGKRRKKYMGNKRQYGNKNNMEQKEQSMEIGKELAEMIEKLEEKAFMEGYDYAIQMLEQGKRNRR